MSPEEFAGFRHKAVHELMRLNELCEKEFRISTWPRWDYDLDVGTLTFSQEGVTRVAASIEVVGTTSDTDNTWLWSWANSTLPFCVTSAIRNVKSFGEKEGITELTSSILANNDHLGWAMSAVATKILGARGAYRCPSKNGFIYLIYNDIGFADLPRNKSEDLFICGTHGKSRATFVCEHLLSQPGQKWFSEKPNETNRWPDAWCAACDEAFLQEGGWSDKNASKQKIKVICHYCYEDLHSKAVIH